MLWDHSVCRIANEKWQQRLLGEEELTYDQARKHLQSLKAVEKGLRDLARDKSIHSILAIQYNVNNVIILLHSSHHNPETWFTLIVEAHISQVHVISRVQNATTVINSDIWQPSVIKKEETDKSSGFW